MKKFLAIVLGVTAVLAVGHKSALASEGTALLTGSGTDARCYIASVLVDEEAYQVVMSCRNLIVPPAGERLFYRAWARRAAAAEPSDKKPTARTFGKSDYLPLGDITGGKLTNRLREAFTEVLVTSEVESSPREPNLDKILVSAVMAPINFGGGVSEPGQTLTATPTSAVGRVSVAPSPKPTGPQVSGRSVVGTAFRLFLGIIGVIVVVAIVISILQRRSASR